MPETHNVTFHANPLQRQFIESRAKADLYSSRMGEGKSTGLAWATLYHSRHNPGAKWALIRDTWENMQATTLKTFMEWFPPGVFGTYNVGRKTFVWAEGVSAGEVQFLGMDDPADASKLMSRELAGFGIDEPAPAVGSAGVAETIFDIAMTRLRQPGMQWYGAKLAENNPDEAHWTYKRWVTEPDEGFVLWQPHTPENTQNLPPDYYEQMRKTLAHRPDLIRRFVEGDFGFQQIGKSVTPQWSDRLNLALGLSPIRGRELVMLWDFGLNPTCIITQTTPMGYWNVLDAMVGDGIGVDELIGDWLVPLLQARYPGKQNILHIGDPAGLNREQSSSQQSAVRLLLRRLGGRWRSGPKSTPACREALRAVMSRTIQGKAVLQVDRHRAQPVWHALRGGWHHHIARSGIVSAEPQKDIHSHPGDAMAYGAAILFPLGQVYKRAGGGLSRGPTSATYFRDAGAPDPLIVGRPGLILPKIGSTIKGP